MKRKLFTFLLAIVASIGLIYADAVKIGDLYYNLDATNKTAEVTKGNYSGLTTADIPASVEHEGETYSVTNIRSWAFEQCTSLTSVTIPNSVTNIGTVAFRSCTSLTSVTIPNSITSIENSAFDGCISLTSIDIPNSVTSIGNDAFYNVLNIIYSGTATGSPWGAKSLNGYVDGWLVYSDESKTHLLGCSIKATGEIIISNSVKSIGKSAFRSCSGLTSITIPNSVTSIGESAFSYCNGLTSVTIPNSVKSIGERTFYNCSGLTSVTIPNSITTIGENAFCNCRNLTSMTIPESVTSIGKWAFSDCSSLTSIEIPNRVTSIEYQTFNQCRSLTSVTIGNSVTSIGEQAFIYCSSLSSVTIPNSVTSIGKNAFANCSSLTSMTLPSSVRNIGDWAFSNCRSLTSMTIPESVRDIGECAFVGCSSLTSVTIPSSITSIEYGTFQDCSSLTSIAIPNSVSSIERQAFNRCTSLTSVTIPERVTSIKEWAFSKCNNLCKIFALPTTPPTILSNTFSDIPTNATVYVPDQSLSAYQSKSYWQDMNLVGIIFVDVKIQEAPTSSSITAVQNLWALDDKYIVSVGVESGETFAGNVLEFTGLEPETEYNKTIVLTSNTGETETINVSFSTTALELTTLQSSIVSSNTAILQAETNMADVEVNCGFEWRRDNQPEAMASTKVYAPVANGKMAGRMKGLKDDVYYKYRAFYESKAGKMVYGDWQYIFTGDEAVEFDPVMYTYPAQAVTETTATLKGYALAGADDFTEQGFEYWVEERVITQNGNNAPRRAYHSAIGEHKTVQTSGISMKVTLTDLDEGSVYKYRTYAVVDGQKVYGAEQSFTTRGEYLYTVTFVDYDGTILGTDKVHYGTAATAPEDPTRDGYHFDGWDNDFSNVTDDLTITATYSIATAISDTHAENNDVRKVLLGGQLFILRGDKAYTVQGQEVR